MVDRILGDALRAPTAGNTRGTAWVALEGPAQTSVYWEATTDAAVATAQPRWEGLRRAPVVLLAYASAAPTWSVTASRTRRRRAWARVPSAWPVPYWTGDAAFGVMTVLLGAVDAGLGACILGNFRGEAALARRLGVPEGWRLFCAVALGRPDDHDHRSPSLDRPGPTPAERIHRAAW